MDEESDDVIIWKTSHRGMGERHVREGYPVEDFPGLIGGLPDGNAYFAKDRWIADEFAAPLRSGYEDFVVEVRIPRAVYEAELRRYEQPLTLGSRHGVQLVIPATELRLLNESGKRTIASDITAQNSD